MHLRSGRIISIMPGTVINIPVSANMSTTTTSTTTTISTTTTTATTNPSTMASTMSTPAQQTPLTSTIAPMVSPTIKLLHHNHSIPQFGGEDSNYSPVAFLQMCDDVIANSHITSGADKIAFVRSQLISGSLASDLMSASAFDPKFLNYDYSKFKVSFLQAFGVSQPRESFQWAFTAAQTIEEHAATLDYQRAQVKSAQLVNQAIDSLNASSYVQNNVITMENFRKIMEFQYYVYFLNAQQRRIASTLDYTNDDSLLDFSTKIATKMKEQPPPSAISAASPEIVQQQPLSAPVVQTTIPQKSVPVCTYCHKKGHVYNRCFLRQEQELDIQRSRRNVVQPSAMSSSSQAYSVDQRAGYRSSSRHRRRRSPSFSRTGSASAQLNIAPPSKNCLIHGPGNHATDECFKILKLQRQQTATAPFTQQNFQRANFQPPKS